MNRDEDVEVMECPGCLDEIRVGDMCSECGWSIEAVNALASEPDAPVAAARGRAPPGVARVVEPQPFPVHEAAWCPHCVAWLGTFPSKAEARAYEASLENHPFEFCVRRKAKLNSSEEWRLRHEVAKFGSLARSPPAAGRVPRDETSAPGVSA